MKLFFNLRTILLSVLFLTGCITIPEIIPIDVNSNKINESNYMKTPCIWDGATVKKKPKVSNIQ